MTSRELSVPDPNQQISLDQLIAQYDDIVGYTPRDGRSPQQQLKDTYALLKEHAGERGSNWIPMGNGREQFFLCRVPLVELDAEETALFNKHGDSTDFYNIQYIAVSLKGFYLVNRQFPVYTPEGRHGAPMQHYTYEDTLTFIHMMQYPYFNEAAREIKMLDHPVDGGSVKDVVELQSSMWDTPNLLEHAEIVKLTYEDTFDRHINFSVKNRSEFLEMRSLSPEEAHQRLDLIYRHVQEAKAEFEGTGEGDYAAPVGLIEEAETHEQPKDKHKRKRGREWLESIAKKYFGIGE